MSVRLLLLVLFAAGLAFPANFAFVQATQLTGTMANSKGFPSSNVAGNVILVAVFGNTGGGVTDSQGNSYIAINETTFAGIELWVATNIKAGANTVTTSTGNGMVAMEYSSVNPAYYVCPGASNVISSDGQGFGGSGSVAFRTASEALALFAAGITRGPGGTWTLTTGQTRFTGGDTTSFGGNAAMSGDDDLPSGVTSTYNNTALYNTFSAGYRITAFLSLTNSTGCVASVVGRVNTYPIIF